MIVAVAPSSGSSHGRGSTSCGVERVVVAEHELVRDVERVEGVLQRRVGVDDLCSGVLDDVFDLGAASRKLIGTRMRPQPETPKNDVSSRAEFCEMTATRPPTGTPSWSRRAACARALGRARGR